MAKVATSMPDNSEITVRYFAKYREWLGVTGEQYAVVVGLQELRELIRARHPAASRMLDDLRCIVAVNQVVVQTDEVSLSAGDEVAFYPPVTGG